MRIFGSFPDDRALREVRRAQAALGAGVDNKPAIAQKANEGEAHFAGEADGKAGRGGDRSQQGHAGDERFLHDLKPAAAAHQHRAVCQRQQTLHERPAYHLVDCVVAADVFADDHQLAAFIEERSGVEAASLAEDLLVIAKARGELAEQFGRDAKRGIGRSEAADANGIDGCLSADAATGGSEEIALKVSGVEGTIRDVDADDVIVRRSVGLDGADLGDLAGRFDEALGEQESGGEFVVVAGSTHGYGQGFRVDADLERFLGCQPILMLARVAIGPLGDVGEYKSGLKS